MPGRFGVSLYGLSVVLMSVNVLGSYTRAGLIGGTFAAAEAIAGPVIGRQADRHGQRVLLPWVAGIHLLGVSGLVLSVSVAHSTGPALACGAVAGASVPQFGALAAARWSRLLHGDRRIETAFSLESLANDVAFIAGPAAAGVLAAAGPPGTGVAVAGVLVVATCVTLSFLRSTEPVPAGRGGRLAPSGVPRGVGFLVVTVCGLNLLLGLTFGTMQLTVAALARVSGSAGYSGLYYMTMSLGSLAASVACAQVSWPVSVTRRLAVGTVVFILGAAGFAANLTLASQFVFVFLIGTGIGPAVIASSILMERYVPKEVLTQAFTVTAAVSAAGIALGALLAGSVIQARGYSGGAALIIAYGIAMLAVTSLISQAIART